MSDTHTIDYQALTDRYLAVWNEPNDDRRREMVKELWSEYGCHVSPRIAVCGYDELEARVQRSYERWVVEERCRFVPRTPATGHHNVVRFSWEMVDELGRADSIGTDLIVLDADDKIDCAYQFIEPGAQPRQIATNAAAKGRMAIRQYSTHRRVRKCKDRS